MDKKPNIVNLPPLPASWNDLTWEQLTGVWMLFDQWQHKPVRYHFEVFCLLSGLRLLQGSDVVEGAAEDGGDEEWMRFRRVGHRGEVLSIRPWEVESWIANDLKWLSNPYKLDALPLDIYVWPKSIRDLCPDRYQLPSRHLTNLTYQQYNNMQTIIKAYWSWVDALQRATKEGSDLVTNPDISTEELSRRLVKVSERIERAQHNIEQCRAQYLAHALVPGTFSLFDMSGEQMRLAWRRVYIYNVETAERNVERMKHAPIALFHVVNQLVQSSLSFFKRQFPDLFTQSGTRISQRTELIAEMGTVNHLMQRLGYKSQQDVYDTNLTFIFEALDSNVKEANEYKKLRNKTHKR